MRCVRVRRGLTPIPQSSPHFYSFLFFLIFIFFFSSIIVIRYFSQLLPPPDIEESWQGFWRSQFMPLG
ncbi:hypothetical protein RJT34_00615 [Clitoria ternatea]|uniref:Uncharacterized protein n=1 Tax=Clitoria ternatea TaxID=43366 RepID=A0AAN9KG79_CLITE